ncbi:hypothetical protein GE061_005126 [Apolygus lucorum]|uniref:Uncharacterized protein n=1 Tax=Apolygus lucorum TaxID=248454 RepID=A0A6A4IPW1_APOLU|nr:hypothetical protein GE061_005126 [Apolygus lucorum]
MIGPRLVVVLGNLSEYLELCLPLKRVNSKKEPPKPDDYYLHWRETQKGYRRPGGPSVSGKLTNEYTKPLSSQLVSHLPSITIMVI